MKLLPPRLFNVLLDISRQEGEDMFFALGNLGREQASSYVSQLNSRGLAYTHRANGTIEVWMHPKGRQYLKENFLAHIPKCSSDDFCGAD